ncbi:MAG: DAK2 domain-containing protein [Clostridia bacterium]|nr:DAK2 domain-containing protein [Clostridia bacterium]
MANRRINGRQLEKMLKNGLRNLVNHKEEVNKLNVFPVADGDTGTNMALTLRHGLGSAPSRTEAGAYLKPVSEGMLMGARGNSGVILSQLFRGMYTELARCGWIGPGELRNALIRAYKTAYAAVVHPVEGTILTVAREGIEHIRTQIDRNSTIEAILSMYIAEMRKSLVFTPELLPVLKEAGVIDSGAYGYILIFEGMLDQLYGKEHTVHDKDGEKEEREEAPAPAADASLFNENSTFEEGYCTEFVLQLMRGEDYDQRFTLRSFIDDLTVYGTSLVAVQDGTRVKVHIHTKKPSKVIALAQEFGEFISFKLENMQLQHNEVLAAGAAPKKPLSIIAAVNGDGIDGTFRELGCDQTVVCGETMNASSEDFVRALSAVHAENVVILPNDKNVIMAAEQAVRISGAENVTVLPSRSPAEGYYALAMDIPDSDDVPRRIKLMKDGMQSTATLTESVAVRDYDSGGVKCLSGEEIVLLNGVPAAASTDWCDCMITALGRVPGIEDAESCVVFRGEGVSEEKEAILLQRMAEAYPMLEATAIYGGQSVYRFIIGISE